MNPFIKDILLYMASYVGIVLAFYFALSWMTKGMIGTFLKVKMSKGKSVLTIVHSKTDVYYRVGGFDGTAFKYKTRTKTPKLLTDVDTDAVYQSMGVFCIDVDESTDNVYTREKKAVIGTNATTADNFVNRAIMSPEVEDPFKRMVILILGALVIAVLIMMFMQYNMMEMMKGITTVGVI